MKRIELLRRQIGDVPLEKAVLLFSDEVDVAIVVPHCSKWNQDHPWLRQLECSDWACFCYWSAVVKKHGVAALLWEMRELLRDFTNISLKQIHEACWSIPEYRTFHLQMIQDTDPFNPHNLKIS